MRHVAAWLALFTVAGCFPRGISYHAPLPHVDSFRDFAPGTEIPSGAPHIRAFRVVDRPLAFCYQPSHFRIIAAGTELAADRRARYETAEYTFALIGDVADEEYRSMVTYLSGDGAFGSAPVVQCAATLINVDLPPALLDTDFSALSARAAEGGLLLFIRFRVNMLAAPRLDTLLRSATGIAMQGHFVQPNGEKFDCPIILPATDAHD